MKWVIFLAAGEWHQGNLHQTGATYNDFLRQHTTER